MQSSKNSVTTLSPMNLSIVSSLVVWSVLLNQIKYYIIVLPKVDQRAGQLCLPHRGITKTEKNTTKT